MKLGLIGFGRTGRLVAQEILRDPEFELCWVLRRSHTSEGRFASSLLGLDEELGPIHPLEDVENGLFEKWPVDTIIDFSSASALHSYYKHIPDGAKLISAISKYGEEELEIIQNLGERISLCHSPNITVGINILIVVSKMVRDLIPFADVEIIEEHFKGKTEVSGTALKIAENLALDPKTHINSVRLGGIVGHHEVLFGLPNQLIRLSHDSTNRAAFGRGAMFAAKLLKHKPLGVYSMENLIVDQFITRLDYLRESV